MTSASKIPFATELEMLEKHLQLTDEISTLSGKALGKVISEFSNLTVKLDEMSHQVNVSKTKLLNMNSAVEKIEKFFENIKMSEEGANMIEKSAMNDIFSIIIHRKIENSIKFFESKKDIKGGNDEYLADLNEVLKKVQKSLEESFKNLLTSTFYQNNYETFLQFMLSNCQFFDMKRPNMQEDIDDGSYDEVDEITEMIESLINEEKLDKKLFKSEIRSLFEDLQKEYPLNLNDPQPVSSTVSKEQKEKEKKEKFASRDEKTEEKKNEKKEVDNFENFRKNLKDSQSINEKDKKFALDYFKKLTEKFENANIGRGSSGSDKKEKVTEEEVAYKKNATKFIFIVLELRKESFLEKNKGTPTLKNINKKLFFPKFTFYNETTLLKLSRVSKELRSFGKSLKDTTETEKQKEEKEKKKKEKENSKEITAEEEEENSKLSQTIKTNHQKIFLELMKQYLQKMQYDVSSLKTTNCPNFLYHLAFYFQILLETRVECHLLFSPKTIIKNFDLDTGITTISFNINEMFSSKGTSDVDTIFHECIKGMTDDFCKCGKETCDSKEMSIDSLLEIFHFFNYKYKEGMFTMLKGSEKLLAKVGMNFKRIRNRICCMLIDKKAEILGEKDSSSSSSLSKDDKDETNQNFVESLVNFLVKISKFSRIAEKIIKEDYYKNRKKEETENSNKYFKKYIWEMIEGSIERIEKEGKKTKKGKENLAQLISYKINNIEEMSKKYPKEAPFDEVNQKIKDVMIKCLESLVAAHLGQVVAPLTEIFKNDSNNNKQDTKPIKKAFKKFQKEIEKELSDKSSVIHPDIRSKLIVLSNNALIPPFSDYFQKYFNILKAEKNLIKYDPDRLKQLISKYYS